MKVKDSHDDRRPETPDTTIAEAAQLMWDGDCGVLPVVDDGELIGVATDRDMYIALATRNERASQLRVGAVATASPVTCNSRGRCADRPRHDARGARSTSPSCGLR